MRWMDVQQQGLSVHEITGCSGSMDEPQAQLQVALARIAGQPSRAHAFTLPGESRPRGLPIFGSPSGPRATTLSHSAGGRSALRAGVLLTPALGAVLMSASTVIVAINARLPRLKK